MGWTSLLLKPPFSWFMRCTRLPAGSGDPWAVFPQPAPPPSSPAHPSNQPLQPLSGDFWKPPLVWVRPDASKTIWEVKKFQRTMWQSFSFCFLTPSLPCSFELLKKYFPWHWRRPANPWVTRNKESRTHGSITPGQHIAEGPFPGRSRPLIRSLQPGRAAAFPPASRLPPRAGRRQPGLPAQAWGGGWGAAALLWSLPEHQTAARFVLRLFGGVNS